MNMVTGLIYKYNKQLVSTYIDKGRSFDIKSISDIYDIEFKL